MYIDTLYVFELWKNYLSLMFRSGCKPLMLRSAAHLQVSTGQLVATAARHYQNVSVLCFTDDGAHLLSGAQDNTVIVWRVARWMERGGGEGGGGMLQLEAASRSICTTASHKVLWHGAMF